MAASGTSGCWSKTTMGGTTPKEGKIGKIFALPQSFPVECSYLDGWRSEPRVLPPVEAAVHYKDGCFWIAAI